MWQKFNLQRLHNFANRRRISHRSSKLVSWCDHVCRGRKEVGKFYGDCIIVELSNEMKYGMFLL
jgi:hypothetical protein